MARLELTLPKMGESVAEATIITWLKAVGERIEEDESVLEIATDKVDSEVPAPEGGVLKEILFQEGDVVKVGEIIAIIETEVEESTSTQAAPPAAPAMSAPVMDAAPTNGSSNGQSVTAHAVASPVAISSNGSNGRFYSPLVRNMAKTEGIAMADLETIQGSGQGGRVTKKDMLAYIAALPSAAAAPSKPVTKTPQASPEITAPRPAPSAPAVHSPAISVSGEDEIIEMDRMRKLIADHMVMSKQVSPHVTSYVEADVTHIVEWREKNKGRFLEKEGQKLTFTPIFIEAIVRAIKEFPMINVSVDGNNIIKRKHINIGMATALPSGNLIVPVIKDADMLNLRGLATQVNGLAHKARQNKLSPDDIQGGTYTVTNVGTFGNVMGTPIINQPQAAIMALGAIRKKPAVIETESGDYVGIRHMMFLSHAYDHRVIDGALGGSFVRKVADFLESFDPNREI